MMLLMILPVAAVEIWVIFQLDRFLSRSTRAARPPAGGSVDGIDGLAGLDLSNGTVLWTASDDVELRRLLKRSI